MVSQSLKADDYKPFVLINNVYNKSPRQFSGVVINQDDQYYYCLSVNHGLDGLSPQETKIAVSVIPESKSSILAISINGTQLKNDEPRDLALIRFSKIENVIIRPLIVGQENLDVGKECISYGFSGNSYELLENRVTIRSYNEHSYKNINLLTCNGPRVFGMSGGPIVFDSKVYGIQSSAGPNDVLYTPSVHINEFLRE